MKDQLKYSNIDKVFSFKTNFANILRFSSKKNT